MKFPILCLILLSQITFSQTNSKYERIYNDTIPEKFMLNPNGLREHIFSQVPTNIRTGEYSRRALNFAHSNAYYISDYISGGAVYSDWNELETYLNEILKKVIPDQLKGDTVIHAYVVRDGTYNAFMAPSGQVFVNIGLLADVPDEATIAGILSHELAHYYLKHSLYTFLEEEAGNFDLGIISTGKARSRYSVKTELQADSLAAVWLQQSGYNLDGLISSFRTMYRLERNTLKRRPSDWVLKETTHPLSQKRLELLNAFYTKNKNQLGKNFLIDEAKFKRFKEEVKPEILKSFLNDFYYYDCIETAFKYHLFDPDNSTYIYYLMEGIRRNCYLNSEIWKEQFITNLYYDSVSVDGNRHKEKMTDNLFKKFDLDIIPIDPRDGVKLKAKFYWKDQPRFTTYEGAYNFFYNVSQSLNCHECILSNALSYTSDTIARNKLLLQYLAFDSIKHRDFAQNMIDGTIEKGLPDHKITVFNCPNTEIEQGYEKIPLADINNTFKIVVDTIIKNQTLRTAVYLPEFKKTHLNDFLDFEALENFSLEVTVSKGERTQLHILDPRYWEMFHKYNVNEIEFVNSNYTEIWGKDKSLDGYRKVINTDYGTLLSVREQTKYYELIISSVREIPFSLMKLRYYDGDSKLISKETNSMQIVKMTRHDLGVKDGRAVEQDKKYRYYNKN